MSQKLHVIYIPGLGDTRVSGQQKAVNTWRWWGVEAELFQMNWANGEAWEAKFGRLLERIDQLYAEGHQIGLVGASAGAGAVINAYAARQDEIVGCVLIAGWVNNPHRVGDGFKSRNPAFATSSSDSPTALEALDANKRKHILSRYALADESVHKPMSRIPGAHNRWSPTIGHFTTIAFQLVIGAPSFIRFLKRQARQNRSNLN